MTKIPEHLENRPEEETRRLLEILMNRYNLRPTDAGKFLAEVDETFRGMFE